jgi:hypothetical protein
VRVVGLSVAVLVVLVSTGAGLALRRRNGRFRATTRAAAGRAVTQRQTLAGLGVTPGTPVTLLQFSTVFCTPCRATRAYCAEVARTVPGVQHVEVDAESHVDAVRALDVWRTPTVLIVDAAGVVRSRASGPMNRAQILAAVAALQPAR